ncbi:hypothetical protein [Actinomadura litoris]|uniref:hypothetical protein n=1 Tax=Actinomadura litoris TaxID=2678616 RepID=UPI001FA6BF54|nr:hypothetical protein [Actinomadura litoris]
MELFEVSADVHALIEDLLPVVNPSARFEPALAQVVLPVGRFEPSATTWTILERCARADRVAWPRLVEEWLIYVSDRAAMAIGDIELLGDVRKRLRIRMVPKLTESERQGLAIVSAGRHFDAMIMIDHPQYGGPLTLARASLLGLTDLGKLAVPNTYQVELADVDVHDQPLTLTESIRVIHKPGSRYVSALVAELHHFLADAGRPGALVAVPTHSTILAYPIVSEAMGAVFGPFRELTKEMYAASDDPTSPDVFWWRREHALVKLDPDAGVPRDPSPPEPKRRSRLRFRR